MPDLNGHDQLYLRALCDESFYHFVKIIGGYVGQGGDIIEEIHKVLCELFQDPSKKRTATFMPRGWYKTSVFTKWGAIWKYLQDNETRLLIAAENEHLAMRFLDFVQKQIMHNKMLRWVYPELQQIDAEWMRHNRWSAKQCDLPRYGIYSEATFTVVGVGGAAQSGHYTDLHIDDPVGKKAMESATVMEGVFRWVDNINELLVNPSYESPTGSRVHLCCTFWSSGDFGNYVMEKYPEYEWMIVPALKDPDLKDTENVKWIQHPYVNEWESNWPTSPQGYTTAHYKDMMLNPEKEMIFWSQHMNNPHRSSGMNKFERNWIRCYRFEDREKGLYVVCEDDKEEFPVSKIQRYGVVDPGGFAETKMLTKRSRNAIVIGGQPIASLKRFILYCWCGKFKEPEKFIDEVFIAHDKFLPRSWRIETYGQQQYIKRDIMAARTKRHTHLAISSCPFDMTDNAKHNRIQALINPWFNGEIYIHRSMKDLIEEFIRYPQGLTMDILDCIAWLNKIFWTKMKAKKPEFRRSVSIEKAEGRDPVTGY